MEKNERGSALVSSLPRSALSHSLTVRAADGYAVEFTLPGLSTCTCHKPKPYTCWEGLIVLLFFFFQVLSVPIGRGFSGFACWIYHIVKFRGESQDDQAEQTPMNSHEPCSHVSRLKPHEQDGKLHDKVCKHATFNSTLAYNFLFSCI